MTLTKWIRDFYVGRPDGTVDECHRAASDAFPDKTISRGTCRVLRWRVRKELGLETGKPEESTGAHPTSVETDTLPEAPEKSAPTREGLEAAVARIAAEVAREVAAPVDPAAIQKIVDDAIAAAPVTRVTITIKDKAQTRDMGETVLPDEFQDILDLASQRLNVLLIGPTGSGKTYVAQKVAEAMGLDFASVSCSAGMSESQLAGWLIPGPGGEFVYQESPFVRTYRDGGVFLFDEFDSADPNTLTFVNAALANGHMFIPHMKEHGGKLSKHPDCVIMAAANTFGTGADAVYVGRNQLDEATLDRFRVGRVFMDYCPNVEEKLIDAAVLKWGRKIRAAIREHHLRRTLSMRVLLELTTMKAACGWKRKKWEDQVFLGWSTDERKRVTA